MDRFERYFDFLKTYNNEIYIPIWIDLKVDTFGKIGDFFKFTFQYG